MTLRTLPPESANDPLASARARIAALEAASDEMAAELARARRMVLALVDLVPADQVSALGGTLAGVGAPGAAVEMFTGWVEDVRLTPSDVATEMALLWSRCSRAS